MDSRQLSRLYRRAYERACKAYHGGLMFGLDFRTISTRWAKTLNWISDELMAAKDREAKAFAALEEEIGKTNDELGRILGMA